MATLYLMQSSKLPRKTSKPAESAAPAPTPERTSKPRSARAKKAPAESTAAAQTAAPKTPEESLTKHQHSLPIAKPEDSAIAQNAAAVATVTLPETVPVAATTAADVQVTHGLTDGNDTAQQHESIQNDPSRQSVTHERIAQLAHSYWAERGYAHGSPEQDWLRAEQHLKSRHATA